MIFSFCDGVVQSTIIGIVAVVFLVLSAEYIVSKMIKLAHHFGVSNTFVGLTVLSIGTSLPEIGSHLMASIGIVTHKLDYKIASSTVLGANIGSDVVQQTFILGLVIFMMGSMTFSKGFLKRSYSVMIGTTLMCLILGLDGRYSRFDGLILFGTFILYMYYLYRNEEKHPGHKVEELRWSIGVEILLTFAGMAVLLFSSTVVLSVVECVVQQTGIAGSLLGVFTLGLASALPELFTAIMGLRQHATGISLGTLIGSNITNPLVAIGLGSLISTYYVPKPLIYWDLPMETVTAALLLIWLLFNKRKLGRKGAIYLMALYFVYAIIRIMFFGTD